MDRNPSFDERELEILQLLWKYGSLKPGQLQSRLTFATKNSGLRWLLNDLVDRGHLRRRKAGKAFVYSAAVERHSLLKALGKKLQNVLFGGSALAMIGELIDIQKLSAKDVEYLIKVASKREKSQGNKTGEKT